jgi:hypothetical protein
MSHIKHVRHEAERAHRPLGGSSDAVRYTRTGTGVVQQRADLMGGQLDVQFASLAASNALIKGGRAGRDDHNSGLLRMLGVNTLRTKRFPSLCNHLLGVGTRRAELG